MGYIERGSLGPTLGRKFCRCCGKWRHLVDFNVDKRHPDGSIQRFASDCKVCLRLMARARRLDPKVRAARQEYERIYLDAKRRKRGVPVRAWSESANRGGGMYGKADAVPSGPFIEWLDGWRRSQNLKRFRPGMSASYGDLDRPIAGLRDLAQLAGCAERAFSRARTDGRVSASLVDRVLVAEGGEMIETVYKPWLYPEIYDFDDEMDMQTRVLRALACDLETREEFTARLWPETNLGPCECCGVDLWHYDGEPRTPASWEHECVVLVAA
jgi:hypothetical protein